MCNTKMKFEEFKDFINDSTTDYKFILYDNTSQSQNENERLSCQGSPVRRYEG